MRNPLYKRIPRELKSDIGKYIALFLFLTLTIGFCSGFLVAGGSMKSAYDESFEKYTIENGHFTLAEKAVEDVLEQVEEEGVVVYELFNKDKEMNNEHTIRFYKMRDDVNRSDLMEGSYPKSDNEIALDRLYAANNEIFIGDKIEINDKAYTVNGFVALSDYSALFKNNTDMMFDANKFCVALVTDNAFDDLDDTGLHYTYAWVNNDRSLTDTQQQDKAEDIMDVLSQNVVITDFVAQQDNNAINFTGDDMGGDRVMIQWLLYIVIAVLAFAFAVTTRNTIEKEASVIGTLRASGYTKGELLRHYIALPLIVTIVAAILGNVLGYTVMKNIVVTMYYHSYSLPTYTTQWNSEAFVLTTIIPALIILVINMIVLYRSLRVSPLQFLRHELKNKQKKKTIRLNRGKFMSRFRVRVILQNMPTYITMFFGIFLASVLMMFGTMFPPLLQNFKTEVQNSKISNYQYILKAPLPTETENAEKYAVCGLVNDHDEEITIYGISKNSEYLDDIEFPKDGVVLSDGLMDKYSIKVDDTITLSEKFDSKDYDFKVSGNYHYPATMAVFMPIDQFNEVFDMEDDYFSGYFSDKEITDIDEMYIASTITEHDLTIMADQLEDSMGQIFMLFCGFSILLFLLMIYLLSKLIIEKNSNAISMIKILGYTDSEARRLYNRATAIVVIISLLISIPICHFAIKAIYCAMMLDYTGWLTFYIAPWVYVVMFGVGIVCYGIIHLIEMKRIRKIPLSVALKNME